ncbi:hypoxanthine-guanine phosphoribosyltransferase [Geobacter sp. SVR]|uniref:hypoxanthine-guanine phosphoribosyltransferase n=1 Tax=Geobacter sp. SVR TaxID=2495594 RepID=UPI00143EF976|nr:hypoxanthine-guanine phosphoribosyltransferase [Geobacter sp. SVR]BCS52451.1 hypoxanthine-guanine phosphoribosyltransferase [Geobacter sp. SVR]GCF84112.1 hypoxanthine-guanine phosphoribosyltransferase [Geobacter sp. SVR]
MTVDEINQVLAEADLLAGEAEVSAAVVRLGAEITARLKDANPVVMCVMNGGLIFAGQLLTRLVFPLEVDYVHATRYGHKTSGARLNWTVRPQLDLQDRTVLLLDDILDEGITLAAIAEHCCRQGASRVLTAVLVEKLHLRKVTPGMRADFSGIEVGDRFLFGYGLDYKGYWRNAPGIYAVKGL